MSLTEANRLNRYAQDGTSNLYWLTDEQMARLRPYFTKSHGRPCVDDRRVLSGIVFVDRNGLRWRDVPKDYSPHKTLYNRWKHAGVRWAFSLHDEGVDCRWRRSEDRLDRRDLFEGAPHGMEPEG